MSVNTPVGTWIPTNNTTQSGSAYLNNIDGDVDVLSRLAAMFLPQALPTPTMAAQVYQGHVYNSMAEPVAVTASTTSGSTSLGSLTSMAGLTIGMGVAGAGIQAGTTLVGLNAAGTATLSVSATATNGSDVLTCTPPSTLIEVGAVTTGSTTSGAASIGSLATVQGIQIGMVATVFSYVAGVFTLAFPSGSIVTGISAAAVTLNNAANSTVAGAWCYFAQPIGATVTGTVTSGANTLGSLTTTNGMFVGMSVAGTAIPANTTIASVTGPTSATMSANATATHANEAIAVTVPVPASNSRLDRITLNRVTGQASWVAGTAAASPLPPSVPLGQVPIAQLLSTTSSVALTNTSTIYDERDFSALGTAPGEFGAQVSIASAATTDLGTIGSNNVLVTGTSAITSFGSTAVTSAPLYVVQFASAGVVLTNGASLVLPGAQNIKTNANDRALALCQGAGVWIVLDYQRANGQAASVAGATASLASAATTDLGTAGANIVAVTGTTTITSLGASASLANPLYWVRFAGALTLTYNATSLILPGAANITTAAGDAMLAEYLGSGNWRVHYYAPATGKSLVSPTPSSLQISVLTSSGSIVLPAAGTTATRYKFSIVGGGGGGGSANSTAQSSGGGGAGATAIFEGSGVAGGTTITCTVGAAGTGATSGSTSAGTTGGTSSIVFNGTTISASGGVGGASGVSAPTGGAGGTATNGTINIPGGGGGAGATYGGDIVGGQGGASSFGGGGAATSSLGSASIAGTSGQAYGSGGGGGAASGAGGNGAGGIIIAEWIL